MSDLPREALQATQALRRSPGYGTLSADERASLDYHLGRIESALLGASSEGPLHGRSAQGYGTAAAPYSADPYAIPLATPNDLIGVGGTRRQSQGDRTQLDRPAAPASEPRPRQPAGTEILGERARRALEAVDFPSFVAELIQGTFVAIVDATSQQVREYAKLVADLSQTVDKFTHTNVSVNQARDQLVERHSRDLRMVLPGPGESFEPRVDAADDAEASPDWLENYGLGGASLTPELIEGPLLDASRQQLGEERMRNLATMVLMGINRIVVDDGQLKARLQFHARAREKVSADIVSQGGGQQIGIAGRQNSLQSAVTTMVSTVDVNSQADVAIKADLVGEVSLKFRTETFDLNNFADASIIQVISRHSLSREAPPGAAITANPVPTDTAAEPQTAMPDSESSGGP
ncbi:MAG: hypothetical protein KZQ95_02155 [Candidatus Thiodiazotropha sp. (ex Epidulcina cf. delphinae)]|nr:hypothetical protein [Candidatus Thiodiazotropha sp. (ex Epidulcina cf. delphinae)]